MLQQIHMSALFAIEVFGLNNLVNMTSKDATSRQQALMILFQVGCGDYAISQNITMTTTQMKSLNAEILVAF